MACWNAIFLILCTVEHFFGQKHQLALIPTVLKGQEFQTVFKHLLLIMILKWQKSMADLYLKHLVLGLEV